MFLHKFNIENVGTVYLLNGKKNPGQLTINLPGKGVPTVSAESVKNFLSNIDGKFRDEPLPEKEEEAPVEEKKEEAPKEEEKAPEKEEKEKKATLASAIRSFASTLKD